MRHDIFISYRRTDAGEKAEHLKDLLEPTYKNRISFDRENLVGEFDVKLIERIARCKDFILVLGKKSLVYKDMGDVEFYKQLAECSEDECIRRLRSLPKDYPLDYVRVEIGRALRRMGDINIIPVVPERTSDFSFSALDLPEDIADIKKYDAAFYSDNPDALFKDVVPKIKRRLSSRQDRSRQVFAAVFAAVLLLVIAGSYILYSYNSDKAGYLGCRTLTDYENFVARHPLFFADDGEHRIAEFKNLMNDGHAYINNTSNERAAETIDVGWADDITYLQLSTIVGMLDSMMYVPAGTFVMGTDTPLDDEDPAHLVTVGEPFYIAKFEVKRGEWYAIMYDQEVAPDSAYLPMNNISWSDCQKFIDKFYDLTALQCSLPTEKQWEYAAKGAGVHQGEIPGDGTLDSVAWHKRNSYGKLHPTSESKSPNALNLYNMLGSVEEWCDDSLGTRKRSVRGGSYQTPPADITITYRDAADQDTRSDRRGMRLVLQLP